MINVEINNDDRQKAVEVLKYKNFGNRSSGFNGNYEKQYTGLIGDLTVHRLLEMDPPNYNDGRIDTDELNQVLSSINGNGEMSEDEIKAEVTKIMERFGKNVNGEDEKTLPFDAFHDWYVNSELYEAEVKAQEKRNAMSGNMRDFVISLSKHSFWNKVAFKDDRFVVIY